MTFLELLLALEHRLGYHQLPVNPRARSIKEVFESSPVHQEFMTQLVRAVYSENRCQRLSDPVTRDQTFAAFAPLRVAQLRSAQCDVDMHHTLDELCLALEQVFPRERAATAPARDTATRAQVVALDSFRRRHLLKP